MGKREKKQSGRKNRKPRKKCIVPLEWRKLESNVGSYKSGEYLGDNNSH